MQLLALMWRGSESNLLAVVWNAPGFHAGVYWASTWSGLAYSADVTEFARVDGTTLNQFIVSAVAEKLAALQTARPFCRHVTT